METKNHGIVGSDEWGSSFVGVNKASGKEVTERNEWEKEAGAGWGKWLKIGKEGRVGGGGGREQKWDRKRVGEKQWGKG